MEQIPNIQHKKPIENLEKIGGKVKAYHEINLNDPKNPENWWSKITFEYVSKPLPHYYLHTLDTDLAERGNGFASQVMGEFESLLHSKKIIGFLQDDIQKDDPAYGMYEKRGWKKIDEYGVYMYDPRPGHYEQEAIDVMKKRYI